MRRAAPLLALVLTGALAAPVGPALAEDRAMLETLLPDLATATGAKALRAASAACLLGLGDIEAVAAPLVAAGWVREDEPEMGMTALTLDTGDAYVMLYDEGRICDVVSEVLGTQTALDAVQVMSGIAGLSLDDIDQADGCMAMALTATARVTITSSGNDPVCVSDTTSALRYELIGG